jgi:hypothetical protein
MQMQSSQQQMAMQRQSESAPGNAWRLQVGVFPRLLQMRILLRDLLLLGQDVLDYEQEMDMTSNVGPGRIVLIAG